MAKPSFRLSPITGGAQHEMNNDDLPDTVTVDLDDKDPNKYEIVEVDDTPEADRGKPTRLDASLDDQEDDLRERLSNRTQKRINRLKFETETERRAREAAERERDAAVSYAASRDEELTRLRKAVDTGSTALANSMKAEREGRIATATRQLETAHADGDAAAIAAATVELGQAQAELVAINSRPARPAAAEEPVNRQLVNQQQQAPSLAPNVAAWISHNNGWFNRDKAKTDLAMSLHKTITSRGVQPSSDEYTRELDKGLKAMYPDHQPYSGSSPDDGDRDERPRRSNVVAEGARENLDTPNPRRVELTKSELAIAQRLRITPQAYAAEKVKREARLGSKGA